MIPLGLFAAFALAASTPRDLITSSCAATVLPSTMTGSRLHSEARLIADRFVQLSSLAFDSRARIRIYALPPPCEPGICAAGRPRYDAAWFRDDLVRRGVDPRRIQLIERRRGAAQFGSRPGTVILIAELPGPGSCGDSQRAPPAPPPPPA